MLSFAARSSEACGPVAEPEARAAGHAAAPSRRRSPKGRTGRTRRTGRTGRTGTWPQSGPSSASQRREAWRPGQTDILTSHLRSLKKEGKLKCQELFCIQVPVILSGMSSGMSSGSSPGRSGRRPVMQNSALLGMGRVRTKSDHVSQHRIPPAPPALQSFKCGELALEWAVTKTRKPFSKRRAVRFRESCFLLLVSMPACLHQGWYLGTSHVKVRCIQPGYPITVGTTSAPGVPRHAVKMRSRFRSSEGLDHSSHCLLVNGRSSLLGNLGRASLMCCLLSAVCSSSCVESTPW